jgi:hypothetical protein
MSSAKEMEMSKLNASNFKIESRANIESGEGATPCSSPRIFDRYYSEADDSFLEVFKEADGLLRVVYDDHYLFDESELNQEAEFINTLQAS